MGLRRFCGVCFSGCIPEGKTPREGLLRTIAVSTHVCALALTVPSFLMNVTYDAEGIFLLVLGTFIGTVYAIGSLVYMRFASVVGERHILVTLIVYSGVISIADAAEAAAPYGIRLWPIFIILADISLVLNLPSVVTKTVIMYACFWQVLIDAAASAGLLKSPVFYPRYAWEDNCYKCSDPPCALSSLSLFWTVTLPGISVFLTDFYVTRRFARQIQDETKRAEAAVVAGCEIASLIAAMDLSGAERVISEATVLREDMKEAYTQIMRILRAYMPYLPAGLSEELSREADVESFLNQLKPPGLESKEVAIVFTDIKSSTMLWESLGDVMQRALKTHNNIMRMCAQMHVGYEVKTIGDAFMIAFANSIDAVSFGLQVQLELLESPWPSELLEHPLCERKESGPWGGLIVRIGIHCGSVSPEMNPITSRTDYMGHTVNIASRVESVCPPGMTAMSERVLTESLTPGQTLREGPMVIGGVMCSVLALQRVTLKGVHEPVSLYTVVCLDMEGRREVQLSPGRSMRRTSSHKARQLSTLSDQLTPVASATFGVLRALTKEQAASPGSTSAPSLVLQSIMHASGRSNGRVATVVGLHVIISWNTSVLNTDHVESCFLFASIFHRDPLCSHMSMGCVNGPAHHGTIGTPAQRFLTVIGSGIELAWQLCKKWTEDMDISFAFVSVINDVLQWPARARRQLIPVQYIDTEHGKSLLCKINQGYEKEWENDNEEEKLSNEWGAFGDRAEVGQFHSGD